MNGTDKHKFKLYIWTITDVFINHKRVNVCKHTVKMAPIYYENPIFIGGHFQRCVRLKQSNEDTLE